MSIFSKISLKRPKRTSHNLSYSSKMTLPIGRLVPMFCEKVVPGDKFIMKDEFMMRFAPFVNQVFQSYQVRTEYFYVPSRLLWNNFEMFLSDGLNGQETNYVHPYLDYKSVMGDYDLAGKGMIGSLFDYFNMPTEFNYNGMKQTLDYSTINWDGHIDALPFMAYIKIFLDYYADENLDYEQYVRTFITLSNHLATDGDNTSSLETLCIAMNNALTPGDPEAIWKPFKRSYPKDYFTSALPWAQRGPVIGIPLNGSGDVNVYGWSGTTRDIYQGVGVKASQSAPGVSNENVEVTLFQYGINAGHTAAASVLYDENGNIIGSRVGGMFEPSNVDPQTAAQMVHSPTNLSRSITFKAVNINGTATITDLRTAITVQEWLEKRARGGARPAEQIYSSFGVKTRDYRLQRSEYLFSSKDYVNIGEVFTTAQNDAGTFIPGLGVSTGKAAAAHRTFKKSFPEHGYVIGIMSIFPTAEYFQGIPRQLLELDKYDYYWPEFQGIGEQPIYNCELYLDDSGADAKETFGYTPRYAHYKTRLNQIHGNFRTNLNFMHAARTFYPSYVPQLDNNFVQVNPEVEDQMRVFNAVGDFENADPVFCDIYHSVKAIRPMNYYGNPRLI